MVPPSASGTLYIVDISSFIFRAFFAIRSLTNRKKEPTNAVYGVATMLSRLLEEAKPEFLVITYDSKEPSFRHEIYDEYKANRSEPPEDLIPQFDRIEQLITSMRMPSFRQPGVEADDLIATLSRQWLAASSKNKVVVVTGDKDLMQLVEERVTVWDTMNNRHYDQAAVVEKFGVQPSQIHDYLSLIGDSSDNIPGAPGVGPKTAVQLLKEYKNLEGVLNAAEAGKISGKKGQVIAENRKLVELSSKLVRLEDEVPIRLDSQDMRYQFNFNAECEALLEELDFQSLVARWKAKSGGVAPAATPEQKTGSVSTTSSAMQSSDATPAQKSSSKPSMIDEGPAQGSLFGASGALSVAPTASADLDPDQFRMINTEKLLLETLEGIDRTHQFGFDLETTSLNPRAAEIVGIAICYDRAFGVYIPLAHKNTSTPQLSYEKVMKLLQPYLENPKYKKIGQNLKYDWSVLIEKGIRPDGIGVDTMVAGYVLDPVGRHNLETLSLKYLDYKVKTYEEVCGKGKDQIGFDQVSVELATRYSAEDALCAFRLWDVMRSELQKQKLMQVFAEIDLPLVSILAKMECQGICLDLPYLKELSLEFEKEISIIEKKIQAYATAPLNLNSTQQLAKLLFDQLGLPPQGKTKTGYSTDASVLEALAPLHEVPKLLLEYREINKLKGTYVDPLPTMVDAKTGKVHAGFHQAVAATGRLSSSDPNLQNIPVRTERGRKIRRAFIPSPGCVFLSADYSQIELRILAHLSGDPELVASFKKGEDVHRRTAGEIFKIPVESVTDRQREIAKALNFGLMYGKTAFGLSQELDIPRKEAQDIIDRYFERYQGVKRLLDSQIQQAMENGYVTTAFGRKRLLPDIYSKNPAIRNNAERMAMNTPIQGTAADLMKLAMISLDEALTREGLTSKLVVQVHDEVVLDCPKDEIEKAEKLVVETMEAAMSLSVPLKANSSVGMNWMEL